MNKIETIKVNFKNMPCKVPLPKDFKAVVKNASSWVKANPGRGRKKYTYVRFHQDYDGEILQTVYAVRYVKATKQDPERTECQLVFAGTPTRRWVSGNLLFGRLCGYIVMWDESESRGGYVRSFSFDPVMYKAIKDDYNPNLQVITPNEDPVEHENELYSLRNWPTYLGLSDMMNDCTKHEIIDYLKTFVDGPMLERLQKAGISYLWREKRLINAKPKFAKKLLTYIRKNLTEIRGRQPSMNFILNAMKLNMTIPQYEWHEVVMAVDRLLCGANGYFMHEQATEVAKYIQKQNGGPVHYRDYLDLSAQMGRNMSDRGVLFPRDFCRQFDEMSRVFETERNMEMEGKIRKQLEGLGLPMRYDHKGFSVRILATQKSMTEIGNELHNCVGASGYGKKMANGEIVILAVYCNGIPMNCVELSTPKGNNMYRVVQNRGDHNLNSPRQKEVETFLQGYIAEANKSWRQCHAGA